jgi:hypothetical protein
MPIAEGLVAIKAAGDVGQKLYDLVRTPDIKATEVQEYLIQLQGHILNARTAIGECEEENRLLQRKLDDREALRVLAEDMEFTLDGQFYVRRSERDRGLIPYCPDCWTKDSKLGHLLAHGDPGLYQCPTHNTYFETETYKAKKRREAEQRRQNPPRSTSWS